MEREKRVGWIGRGNKRRDKGLEKKSEGKWDNEVGGEKWSDEGRDGVRNYEWKIVSEGGRDGLNDER